MDDSKGKQPATEEERGRLGEGEINQMRVFCSRSVIGTLNGQKLQPGSSPRRGGNSDAVRLVDKGIKMAHLKTNKTKRGTNC